jgi:hypothetical protein
MASEPTPPAFYLVGPFFVPGMSPKEPYIALVVVGLWGVYGFIYFTRASGVKGKAVLLPETRRA